MPAGSLEKLKLAVRYGADAVYMGTPDLSLRAQSAVTLEQVVEGIEYAHAHGTRVYLTLNLFSHNRDMEKLPGMVETIQKVKPDGVIVADPGVFHYLRQHVPEVPLHISTQANVCSWLSVKFWEDQGADLCVLAREVSFQELTEIREKCPEIKLEAFVHGSMCMTYSGRCLLSNYMAERGANQGSCAHSCRWNYKLHARLKDGTLKEIELTDHNQDLFEFFMEEHCRPGELMPLEEDSRGSYILNSKDLCLMPKLDEYLKLGVDSLKVEGRNKSLYYLAIVTRAYRMAIDDYYRDPENWDPNRYLGELYTIPNRGYTLAFHEGRLENFAHNYDSEQSLSEYEFAGIIRDTDDEGITVEVKNRLVAGDVLEFVSPTSRETVLLRMYEFVHAEKGTTHESVHGGQGFIFKVPYSAFDREDPSWVKEHLVPMTVLRKDRNLLDAQKKRVSMDKVAQKVELEESAPQAYDTARSSYLISISSQNRNKEIKKARLGVDGCCGKGCNGCLIFSHDPSFAKARELYAKKKIGEKLEFNMRDGQPPVPEVSSEASSESGTEAAL